MKRRRTAGWVPAARYSGIWTDGGHEECSGFVSVAKNRPVGQKGTILCQNPPQIRAIDTLHEGHCVRVSAVTFPGIGARG